MKIIGAIAGSLFLLVGLVFIISSLIIWIRALADDNGDTWEKVIYCKDCKYYKKLGCAIAIVDETDAPGDTDYCSFAEKA